MKEVYAVYDTREDTRYLIEIFSNRESAEKCLLDRFSDEAIEAELWCYSGMTLEEYKKELINPNRDMEMMGYIDEIKVYDNYPLEEN